MEATANTESVQQQETKWYVLRVVSGKEKKVKEYRQRSEPWGRDCKTGFLPVEKCTK
jgi:transcriptional antiterminator NusG